MDIEDFQTLIKAFHQNPGPTIIAIVLLSVISIVAMWCAGFFGEVGRVHASKRFDPKPIPDALPDEVIGNSPQKEPREKTARFESILKLIDGVRRNLIEVIFFMMVGIVIVLIFVVISGGSYKQVESVHVVKNIQQRTPSAYPSVKPIENSEIQEMKEEIEKLKKDIADLQKNQTQNLRKNFPVGYQVFGILGDRIVPSPTLTPDGIKLYWSTARVLNATKDEVAILMPDADIFGSVLRRITIVLPNKVGAVSSGAIDINGWSTFVEILKSEGNQIIAAVGFKKTTH